MTTLATEDIQITELFPYEEDDSGNAKAHIVNSLQNKHIDTGGNMSSQDVVNVARLAGQEVVALCGYKWIPKLNPDKHDACEKCIEIAHGMLKW